MTKHSRFGHNSYSNPFMRPDTRQRGELLYLSVIGSRLKCWTVIGQNCPGQLGTGNGTNMIYLMSENCCRDTWRSWDRIRDSKGISELPPIQLLFSCKISCICISFEVFVLISKAGMSSPDKVIVSDQDRLR